MSGPQILAQCHIIRERQITGCRGAVSYTHLFGCGKSEETAVQPIVQPIVEQQPEKEEDSSPEEAETEADLDTPPAEGMVRSRLTNEWVDEDVANTRPVAIMIPNSKTASQYSISDEMCIRDRDCIMRRASGG